MAANVILRFIDSGHKPYPSGECTIEGYTKKDDGWIEVGDCSFTLESESSADRGTGSAGSPPTLSDFSFSHYYDQSSPAITRNFATGTPFQKVEIKFLKPTGLGNVGDSDHKGARFDVYCQLIASGVYVTKVTNKADEDGKIDQDVEMKCKAMALAYLKQDEDGTFGSAGKAEFGYDFIKLESVSPRVLGVNLA